MTIKGKRLFILKTVFNQFLGVQDMLKLYFWIRSEEIQIIISFFSDSYTYQFLLEFWKHIVCSLNDKQKKKILLY